MASSSTAAVPRGCGIAHGCGTYTSHSEVAAEILVRLELPPQDRASGAAGETAPVNVRC